MGANDLYVTVSQRKLACVVDPALALSMPRGAALTLRLAGAFEAWLPRSFWQVLDASELITARLPQTLPLSVDGQALAEWLLLRETTDAGSWTLRWLGDCVAESQLRDAAQIDLVERAERLLASLLDRLPEPEAAAPWQPFAELAHGAADVAALSAALEGALVLCMASGDGDADAPALVRLLERAGVPLDGPTLSNETGLLAAERQFVRQALAGAGAAPLLQGHARLAAVHVLADAGDTPWQAAAAWWYWI